MSVRSMNYFPGVVSEPPYRTTYAQPNYVATVGSPSMGGGMSSGTMQKIGLLIGAYLAWSWSGGISAATGTGCKVPGKGPGKSAGAAPPKKK